MYALGVTPLLHRLEKMFCKKRSCWRHDARERVEHITQGCEGRLFIFAFLFKPVTRAAYIPRRKIVDKLPDGAGRAVQLIRFKSFRRLFGKLRESREDPAVQYIVAFI